MLLSQAGGPLPTGVDVRNFVLTSCQRLYHSTVLTSRQYGRRKNSCRVGRWFRQDHRRLEPATWFPARSRAGDPGFLRESPDAKSRGGCPPPPFFIARSFPLARFGVGGAAGRSLGYFATHLRALIWKLSFAKMLSSIFFPENASQIGFSIPEVIAPRTDQR